MTDIVPGGPIERYLRELHSALSYPAPRLIHETRAHLVEAAEEAAVEGASPADAEARAVASYGPVDRVVAAVTTEGSAVLSPRGTAVLSWLGLILCLPTLVFFYVNVIEIVAGNSGGLGVFGSTFDEWSAQIEVLLVFGPLAALALIVMTSLRVERTKGVDGFAATVHLRMTKWSFRAALVILAVVIGVVSYGIVENYSAWRDFRNGNWECTATESGQPVCYQGRLPRAP